MDFIAGNGDVCDALELLVLSMHKGERARLTCSGAVQKLCADDGLRLELGLRRCDGSIPTVIVFQAELCDFEISPELHNLSQEEKVELAEERKNVGNALFR